MADLDRIAELIAIELERQLGTAPDDDRTPGPAPRVGIPPTAGCDRCDGHCAFHCAEKVRRLVASGAERISAAPGIEACDDVLARMIDHTLLSPAATRTRVERLCDEADANCFAAVCVNPWWVRLAARRLAESPVRVCTVVGFPLGANRTETKVYEAVRAVEDGATELDMVINVGALKSADHQAVENDIAGVVKAAEGRALVKVILETALLDDREKVKACVLARAAGARFVKTSTGFGGGGATEGDVRLMHRVVGDRLGVKASGGVKDQPTALKMIEAGATRIGASAGVAIVRGESDESDGGYGGPETAKTTSAPGGSKTTPRAVIHKLA